MCGGARAGSWGARGVARAARGPGAGARGAARRPTRSSASSPRPFRQLMGGSQNFAKSRLYPLGPRSPGPMQARKNGPGDSGPCLARTSPGAFPGPLPDLRSHASTRRPMPPPARTARRPRRCHRSPRRSPQPAGRPRRGAGTGARSGGRSSRPARRPARRGEWWFSDCLGKACPGLHDLSTASRDFAKAVTNKSPRVARVRAPHARRRASAVHGLTTSLAGPRFRARLA